MPGCRTCAARRNVNKTVGCVRMAFNVYGNLLTNARCSSDGYRRQKTAICTRNLSIFAPPAGTAALKLLPVPVALMRERNFRNPFDGCLAFVHNLKDIELQVLFEQMLDFTGVSGTQFLNLPLAYHSFFCYIKFAIRSISSVSVLSRTWQYRSIVICKEL